MTTHFIDGQAYASLPSTPLQGCRGCVAQPMTAASNALCRKLACLRPNGEQTVIFIRVKLPKEQPMNTDTLAIIKTNTALDAASQYREHRTKHFNTPMPPRMDGFAAGFDKGFDAGVTAERTRLGAAEYKASQDTAPQIERKAGKINDLIVTSLRTVGPASADDLSQRLGIKLNSISPRMGKLKMRGLVHVTSGQAGSRVNKSVFAYGAAPI